MAALELPVPFPVRAKTFKLIHKQQVTASGPGFIQTIDRANPMWYCEYETAPRDHGSIEFAAIRSVLDRLEGSMNTFLAYDPRRPKPLYHMRHGGSPPAATITAIDWTNSKIQLSGLPTGRITVGDYISYQQGNIWRLYRATADLLSDGWIFVTPRPLVHTGLPIALRLEKPCAEMKMMGDYNEEDSVDSFPVLKLTGFQFINRA